MKLADTEQANIMVISVARVTQTDFSSVPQTNTRINQSQGHQGCDGDAGSDSWAMLLQS
ncbi:hypothetical protein BDN71DRAFT_1450896 [Pleurotus eryngii]|uniref:Uncharacterized protein n=1 Tax=Pleurotus eryngii TaxID=5323 RepID=A0A9P5ZRH8_PLEER|nr:hypothetical protein BDN71DRAFT_1450896 [Pleurotus eryngii]